MTILLISIGFCLIWPANAQQHIARKKSIEAYINCLSDSSWVRLSDVDKSLIFDIKYATSKNFTGKVIYPCSDVMLRKEAALALKKANDYFKSKGFWIKVFDAYRPPSAQWMLWHNTPNKLYVSDPRKGSKHSAGIAIDLTLVDKNGIELNMGTPYDSFSPLSHHGCTDLPQQAIENRLLLKNVMESVGFTHIKNEWWHYNFIRLYSIVEIPFDCN